MNIDYSDKVVLVTGGGAGIGRAICQAFADAHARVACVDLDVLQGSKTIDDVRGHGAEGVFIEANVANADDVRRYVRQVRDEFGRIDVLVNNAGIEGAVLALTEYPESTFDRVMEVNVRGTFLGMKYVLPVMQEQRAGSVINMGSTGSHVGATGVCAYTASKHAILGLTRSAALEVAHYGIRVNAICPGSTRTRMLQSLVDARSKVEELAFNIDTPNRRIAEPAEIAATALFLASDQARHIVGQSIILDGGRLAM